MTQIILDFEKKMLNVSSLQFYSDYFYKAPQDAIVKTLVRNRVDTYMYVQNTTVEALKLPWWRQITHNLEHYFLSGAPFMDPVFFSEDQQVRNIGCTTVLISCIVLFIFCRSVDICGRKEIET